jgi:riboflavin biosynthesis pyrimidine reductase
MDSAARFAALEADKTSQAERASIAPLRTVLDRSGMLSGRFVGNAWTLAHYDGTFHLCEPPDQHPAVSLVFVRSRDGNTGADNPATLGGGPVDLHLIYEGLTRVAADAVLAGAGSAGGDRTFFSVWHPEIVTLRRSLGLPRHPAQIVVSNNGRLNFEALLFNVTEIPVFILAGRECQRRCERIERDRPWLKILPLAPAGLSGALRRLRSEFGLSRISAIGGRSTATALIDEGLVQDLCLTTTTRHAGEPNTPFYTGANDLRFETIATKTGSGDGCEILVEHLRLLRASGP